MRRTFRTVCMGICVHLLVSAFLLAGIRVMQSGYNRMHTEPIAAASLRVEGEHAELQVLTQTVTIPLGGLEPLPAVCYLLADSPVQFWVGVILEFMDCT